jgi:hypothetical protein
VIDQESDKRPGPTRAVEPMEKKISTYTYTIKMKTLHEHAMMYQASLTESKNNGYYMYKFPIQNYACF